MISLDISCGFVTRRRKRALIRGVRRAGNADILNIDEQNRFFCAGRVVGKVETYKHERIGIMKHTNSYSSVVKLSGNRRNPCIVKKTVG